MTDEQIKQAIKEVAEEYTPEIEAFFKGIRVALEVSHD